MSHQPERRDVTETVERLKADFRRGGARQPVHEDELVQLRTASA